LTDRTFGFLGDLGCWSQRSLRLKALIVGLRTSIRCFQKLLTAEIAENGQRSRSGQKTLAIFCVDLGVCFD
jgi:hypothetical protein